jgi:hypothetical protein
MSSHLVAGSGTSFRKKGTTEAKRTGHNMIRVKVCRT